ncbi:hypothetical protein LTS18_000420, partial [Coniosporium uncinatum]
MPYKHIAAHLKKTELACRLHYHQLSHGSHRRKRTNSLASASSSGSGSTSTSPSSVQYPSYEHDSYGTEFAGYDAHGNYGEISPQPRYSSSNSSPGRVLHKVLLPKPGPNTTHGSAEQLRGLRINTTGNVMRGSNVDTDRLRAIYDQHRSTFWNSIAAEYGPD